MTLIILLIAIIGCIPLAIGVVACFASDYPFGNLSKALMIITGLALMMVSMLLTIMLSPSVSVTKDFSVVWKGKKHCLDVTNNLGDTHIKTYKGFLCLTPDKYFYGKDIEVNSGVE